MTDPLIAAAQFLVTQLPWLAHATDEHGGPYAASVFAEIRDCASRMRATVEGPADRRYLGPCGAPITEIDQIIDEYGEDPATGLVASRCEGDVYARDGAPAGHCRTCGATYALADRQKWLDEVRRDWLYHASEIADAYPDVNENSIRTWLHRGQITAHGEHDGRPLFKLGEVLDQAADSVARREEQRAARERRRAPDHRDGSMTI
jgi:hypothetical protein